jgi:hypothetical protein
MAIRPEGEESDGGAGGAVRTSDEGERIRAEKPDENVRRITDPRKPSEREVEDHNRTHLPYRNWCPHCVKAKGKDLDHRKVVNDERVLNEFSFDYCFPGNELGYKLTVLVGRERTTGMTMATVIPSKGGSGKFVADKVMEFLAECGNQSGDIIVKSDQEPAIAYLVKDIVAERGNEAGCRTIVEESPVRSHGSNGVVERAVQTIEGQIRVMKLALEDRIGRAVDAEAPVVTFMAEYASYLLNRLEVGKDGKTAHERVKGKTASVLGLEFGEKLLWKRKPTDKMDKISSRWDHGVFVGVRVRSGEFWVATVAGVRKVRSVRRIPEDERWSEASVKWVKMCLGICTRTTRTPTATSRRRRRWTPSRAGRGGRTRNGRSSWGRGRWHRARSTSAKKTPRCMATPAHVRDVRAGSGVSVGNLTPRSAERDLPS